MSLSTVYVQNCYRDTSTLMHAGVAMADAAKGRLGKAAGQIFQRSVAQNLPPEKIAAE